MKKRRSSAKEVLHCNANLGFPVLEPLGFLALFYFFWKKKVNITFMYLLDLNMLNIKPEALAEECSKRKVFLKILQNSLENNCARESLL